MPSQSMAGRRELRVSGTSSVTARAAINAIGTFMKKIHCQPAWSSSSPPTIGPSGIPMLLATTKNPIAFLRSSSVRKRTVISESATGTIIAAPMPRNARAAIRPSAESARPQASEAAPNRVSAIAMILRRPYRSPRRPAGSRRAARTRL